MQGLYYYTGDYKEIMKTKITVAVDNIGTDNLCGEWGLCLYIEYGDTRILADSGQSDLFLKNLEAMGIDVKDIDYATLSHAHYDHANGMPYFFEANSKAKFYLRDAAEENAYKKVWIIKKYIGLPKHILEAYPDRIVKVSGDYKLTEGAYLIPHKTPGLEAIGRREKMLLKTKKGWKPDDFSHEQSLVLDTDKGLVIINCCSHGGVINIINEVRETFPDKHVYGIIGGFHLFNKTEEEIRTLGKKIKETGIDYVCTGHCTGGRAYHILKEELGDTVNQLKVGLIMEF